MATQPRPSLTAQEYLALDRAAEFKSEFVDGIMYAMAGGSIRHSLLAAQLIADLTAQLRGRCSVLTSDARVWTPVSGAYFFPDVSVVCGDPQTQEGSDDTLTNPCLIAEVLSPSTADYDHGKKFAHYREIPTLDIYLLIHPDKILIEHFARQSDGNWLLSEHRGLDANVALPSLRHSAESNLSQLGSITAKTAHRINQLPPNPTILFC